MLSLKILRSKMLVCFKDHQSIQFYLRWQKLSWVYTCILQLIRSLGRPRIALLNRRRSLSEISTMTKPSVSLITSHQTSSPGDLNSLFVIFVLWSSVIYLLPPYKKLRFRRTTWAEEKKLNIETFGVPGRFLRGRGFRGRGRRGLNATEQRALPKVGSGRVWRISFC